MKQVFGVSKAFGNHMSGFWHLAITGLTAILAVYLHRALWRTLRSGDRARVFASFRVLCVAMLFLGISGLATAAATSLRLADLPPHSAALVISAAGMLGIWLCLDAGMDAVAVFASGVVLSGLFLGLSSGMLWWGGASVLSIAYLLGLCKSLNRIVISEKRMFENNDANIAGNNLSLDEAYSHSR